MSAHDYLQAMRLRARTARIFVDEVFAQVDVLATPTIPEPAPALAAAKAGAADEIVRRMNRFSRLTRPFNALGLPALSVPCGFSGDGRPVGLQLIGRPFDEARSSAPATPTSRRRPGGGSAPRSRSNARAVSQAPSLMFLHGDQPSSKSGPGPGV